MDHFRAGLALKQQHVRRITWEDWNRSYCAFDVDLRIDEVDCAVAWGDHRLGLGDRPQMLRLIRAFLEAPGHRLNRGSLVQCLYQGVDFSTKTERYVHAKGHNAVKMISRTRGMMEQAFARCGAAAYDWFPYSKLDQTWELMQLKRMDVLKAA